MFVLLAGFLLFAAAFFVHLALWRLRPPRRQTRALLLIFIGLPAVLLPLIARWPQFLAGLVPGSYGPAAVGLATGLHVLFFCVALALAYITTVGEIEVDSPSLMISLMISRAGASGVSRAQLAATFTDAVLVQPRLADMLRDGMAVFEGGRYRITGKGLRLARLFNFYRRLLGLTDAGG